MSALAAVPRTRRDPHAIAQTILTRQTPDALGLLKIYRNTVWRAWLDAMQQQFPSACASMGDAVADEVIRAYLHGHPPQSGVLLDIGVSFPAFLHGGGSAHLLHAKIAQCDWLWSRSHVAADAPSLTLAGWHALLMQPDQCVVLHPACYWYAPDSADLAQQWSAGREGVGELTGVGLLFGRPFGAVESAGLTLAELACLERLKAGEPLTQAIEAAYAVDTHIDFSELGAKLLHVGVISCLLPAPWSTHD